MKSILIICFILFVYTFGSSDTWASTHNSFDYHMQSWEENRQLASKSLLEAEKALKEGDLLTGCVKQSEASKYGVEATQSLIEAFKIKGDDKEIENFKYGLDKWKELGDLC